MRCLDEEIESVGNLEFDEGEEIPCLFSLVELMEKNKFLGQLCSLVEDGTFTLRWKAKNQSQNQSQNQLQNQLQNQGVLTLYTPLNTEHVYSLESTGKLKLISQKRHKLTVADLRRNTKSN